MVRVVVGARVNVPDPVPPPLRLRVPVWTSTTPVLLNAIPTAAVPSGPDRRNVPSLLNAAAPGKNPLSDELSWMVNVLPARLFQTALFVNVRESPTGMPAVPWLSTTRPSSFEKNPPPSAAVPFRIVRPVPAIVPLPDQDHFPSMVRSPAPLIVPPVWVRSCTVVGPLRVSVPLETVSVLDTCAGPATVSDPPNPETVSGPVLVRLFTVLAAKAAYWTVPAALMVTSSAAPGSTSPDQFGAWVQLTPSPPPSQETAAGVSRSSSASRTGRKAGSPRGFRVEDTRRGAGRSRGSAHSIALLLTSDKEREGMG